MLIKCKICNKEKKAPLLAWTEGDLLEGFVKISGEYYCNECFQKQSKEDLKKIVGSQEAAKEVEPAETAQEEFPFKIVTEQEHRGSTKKCPYCAEEIQYEAVKCRYCGSIVKMKSFKGVSIDSSKQRYVWVCKAIDDNSAKNSIMTQYGWDNAQEVHEITEQEYNQWLDRFKAGGLQPTELESMLKTAQKTASSWTTIIVILLIGGFFFWPLWILDVIVLILFFLSISSIQVK